MKGVAAYLKDEGDGKLRLALDDVEAISEKEGTSWKHIVSFTSNSYDANSLKELSLSKEQFSEIGENLVIRLLAMGGLIK